MSKSLQIAKKIAQSIVFIGTAKIVGDIIKNNTDPESMTDKVTYTAGGYALGGLVAAEASKYAGKQFDETFGPSEPEGKVIKITNL